MENTDKQMFRELRKYLPKRYAHLLFHRYKRENMQISKILIYKIAAGGRYNEMILNDLLKIVEERDEFLLRKKKFEKRLGIGKKKLVQINKQ